MREGGSEPGGLEATLARRPGKRGQVRRGELSRGGARVTAVVSVLAFVAVANAVSGGARVLYNGQQLRLERLIIYIGVAALLSLWALARVRRQWDAEATGSAVGARDEGSEPELDSYLRPSRRRSGWLRRARWAATVAMVAVAALTIVSEWSTLTAGLDQLSDLHWTDLRWAAYAEALALIAFAQLTRLLLSTGGVRLRFGSMLGLTVASNAMALTLPGGPAWAATFSFDQLRRRGVRAAVTAYSLAVTWVFSAIALLVIALVGIDLAGGVGPAAPFRVLATVVMVLLGGLTVACVLVVRLPRLRSRLARELDRLAERPRWRRVVEQLHDWVAELASVRLPATMLTRCFALAILNWVCDCGCLVFSILAVGGHVPWQAVLAAYGLTQLAAALPITPGGIGLVEGTLTVLLIAYHMPATTAVAAVVLYRIISFWILVPIGWAAVGALVAVRRRGRAHVARAAQAARVSGTPAAIR